MNAEWEHLLCFIQWVPGPDATMHEWVICPGKEVVYCEAPSQSVGSHRLHLEHNGFVKLA